MCTARRPRSGSPDPSPGATRVPKTRSSIRSCNSESAPGERRGASGRTWERSALPMRRSGRTQLRRRSRPDGAGNDRRAPEASARQRAWRRSARRLARAWPMRSSGRRRSGDLARHRAIMPRRCASGERCSLARRSPDLGSGRSGGRTGARPDSSATRRSGAITGIIGRSRRTLRTAFSCSCRLGAAGADLNASYSPRIWRVLTLHDALMQPAPPARAPGRSRVSSAREDRESGKALDQQARVAPVPRAVLDAGQGPWVGGARRSISPGRDRHPDRPGKWYR